MKCQMGNRRRSVRVPLVKASPEGGDHGDHIPNVVKYQVEGVVRPCYGRSNLRRGGRELDFEYTKTITEGVDKFGKEG